jgi:hypothetical protein
MKHRIYISAIIVSVIFSFAVQGQQTYFRCQSNTGVNSTVIIPVSAEPKVDGQPLQVGDEVAVFTPDGLCVGLAVWTGSNLPITVWGDNEQTPIIDGILPGQEMMYRVYFYSKQTEFNHINVEYSDVFPATRSDGFYYPNNIYVIQSLESYIPAPGRPVLKSPADQIVDQPLTVTLVWYSLRFADSYHVQVSTEQSFTTLIADAEITDDTTYTVSDLEHFTEYYWRVSAKNVTSVGVWSETWTFKTIIDFPAVPSLHSPAADTVNQPTNVQLSWHPAPNAQTYDVQVSRQQNFGTQLINASGIADTVLGLTNLDHKTDYWWRVRAVNYRAVSDWSDGRRFTTIVNFPPSPILESPDDNATNIPVNTPIRWSAAQDAETYHIQISRSAAFSTMLIDSLGIDTTSIVPIGLLNNTQYFWRVRGANIRGSGNWSSIWNYTTSPKSLILLSPGGGEIWKAGTMQRIEWSFVGVTNVKIELSNDNGNIWQTIAASVNASTGFYMWEVLNESSLSCKIRISDAFDAGLTNMSQPFAIYPQSYRLDYSQTFGNHTSITSYRMIGIPGALNRPVADVLIGEPKSDWTVYHDNGSPNNYLIEYDGTPLFTFEPGRGFWVLGKNGFSLRYEVGSAQLAEDYTYSIQLHNGWNIISNPFGTPVSWNAVLETNSISETLWAFNGQYSPSTSFEPYKGYYFFNSTELSALKIPYPSGNSISKPAESPGNGLRTISISLTDEDIKTHPVYVHVPKEAGDRSERFFQYAPPGDFQELSVALIDDELSSEYKFLSEDSRELSTDGYVFTIVLTSNRNRASDLLLEGLDMFEGVEMLLMDRHTGKTFDIQDGIVRGIIAGDTQRELNLFIGSESYIREMSLSQLPTVFTLSQNFPNPFNPETTIEYSIPEGTSTHTVTLEIYNLLGQKIRTLVDTPQSPGFYSVRWDGMNDGGHSVPSGVYLYIIRTGSFTEVHRMTLLR